MVDRDPYDGQADGDVDPVVAVDRLERRVALVVVADDHEVPLALHRLGDERVGGQRAVDVEPGRAGARDGRREHVGVLVAEDAGSRRRAG